MRRRGGKRYRVDRHQQQRPLGSGEQGCDDAELVRAAPQTESLDPNLEDTYTGTGRVVRTRAGAELRRAHRFRVARRRQRFERVDVKALLRFTVPVTIPDPGPENVRGNADDGAPIAGFNLAQEFRGRASQRADECSRLRQRLLHVGDHRHQALQQPLVAAGASYGWTGVRKHHGYGNTFRSNRRS